MDNPADLMARDVFPDALLTSTHWLARPAWLARDDQAAHWAPAECDVWSGAAESVVCERSGVCDASLTPTDSASEPMVPAQPAAAADTSAGTDGELVGGVPRTAVLSTESVTRGHGSVIAVEKYDSLGKVTCVMAYALRFFRRASPDGSKRWPRVD